MNTRETKVEALVSLVLGELSPARAAEVEAEAARAPSDKDLLDRLRGILETLRTSDAAEPGPALVARVKALFRKTVEHGAPGLLERVREIVATLVFDSRAVPVIAGFRGAPSGYQLAYSSEIGDVDLQVTAPEARAGGLYTVRGQVSLQAPRPAAPAFLTRPGESLSLASAPVDDRGLFSMKAPAGTFNLHVPLGDALLTVPALQIE